MVQHNDVVKTQSKTIAQSKKSSYGEISEICLKLTLKTELLMLTLNWYLLTRYPENIYVFKANYRNTRKKWNMFKVNNTDTWTTSSVFIVTSNIIYIFSWTDFTNCSGIFIGDFEKVNAGWIQPPCLKVNCCLW